MVRCFSSVLPSLLIAVLWQLNIFPVGAGSNDSSTLVRAKSPLPDECHVISAEAIAYVANVADAHQALAGTVEAEKQAHRRLDALREARQPLQAASAEAARQLQDVSDALKAHADGGATVDADTAHDLLAKAQDFYQRTQARAAQVVDDISGVVAISQQVLTTATKAHKAADRTLALATALKRQVDTQQGCVEDAWGAFVANSTDKLKRTYRTQMQQVAANMSQVKKREANADNQVATAKQMRVDLVKKEAKDKAQLEEHMKKLEDGLAHVWRKAKRDADKELSDAKDIKQDALHLHQQGSSDLQDAHTMVQNNTRLKELADQEMRDVLSVMKGLDPGGRHALQQGFAALENATAILRQARRLCGGVRVLVGSPGSGDGSPSQLYQAMGQPVVAAAEPSWFQPWLVGAGLLTAFPAALYVGVLARPRAFVSMSSCRAWQPSGSLFSWRSAKLLSFGDELMPVYGPVSQDSDSEPGARPPCE